MSITYVTALYDIYHDQDKLNFYVTEFEKLCDITMILFVDDTYLPLILPRHNLTIIHLPLCNTVIYPLCQGPLPSVRNEEKDTQAYLGLMNTKIEFVYRSLYHVKTPYIAWIDAGVMKLITNKSIKHFLSHWVPCNIDHKILIPGCWPMREVSTDAVCWRFCGTFWVSHIKNVSQFYHACLKYINPLTWEVNVWAKIELNQQLFQWYPGDHNDQLFNVPEQYKQLFKITKSSVDGIGNVLKGFISAYSINDNTKIECSDAMMGRYDTVLNKKHIYVPAAHEPFYTCRFLVLKNEEMDQLTIVNEFPHLDGCGNRNLDYLFSFKSAIDWNYDITLVSPRIVSRILDTINRIEFLPMIMDQVNNIKMIHPSLAISVRTWTSKHEHDIHRSYDFETYKNAIVKVMDQFNTIVVSLDNDHVKNDYVKLLQNKNVIFINNEHVNELQNAAIKMLILSKCNTLIANRISTFSELVFWFSQCKQHVIPLY